MLELCKIQDSVFEILETELPKNLTYHTVDHTKDVYNVALERAAIYKLNESDTLLLGIAALYHDIGFIQVYDGHEEAGVRIMRSYLSNELTEHQLNQIEGMIMATKTPQYPHNLMERILADADLDYLGREDFMEIDDLLFSELLAYGKVADRKSWDELQIDFLYKHEYHTGYARFHRKSLKDQRLTELKQLQEMI